jgi:Zn-dependent peptidase ImmA (M78 family)
VKSRVNVKPELLRWAADRGGFSTATLARRFPRLDEWLTGQAEPTLKQLEQFAQFVHAPVGYFFLAEPPLERLPIPDFRTISVERPRRPSADLLDTLYLCQQRQEWYRDAGIPAGEGPLVFVGSARPTDSVVTTATTMRAAIGFDLEDRRRMPTWPDALRRFITQVDSAGVLVMVSGVVGSNNRRKLEPEEFRGFALVDQSAPLIFVNGADSKAAQMFTLAHEFAHIWLGQSALSDAGPRALPEHAIERWCNEVAAEFLVPLDLVRSEYRRDTDLAEEVSRLASRFKVSSLVILRRLHDTGRLPRDDYWQAYDAALARIRARPTASGGDFYLTLAARVSRRFARAVVVSTLEGRSSFTDAFRLLGFRKMATFRDLAHSLGASA